MHKSPLRLIWTDDPDLVRKREFKGQLVGVIGGSFDSFGEAAEIEKDLLPALRKAIKRMKGKQFIAARKAREASDV